METCFRKGGLYFNSLVKIRPLMDGNLNYNMYYLYPHVKIRPLMDGNKKHYSLTEKGKKALKSDH